VLELDCGQDFDPSRDEDFFAALPPRPAVCLIETRAENAEPFLIRTQDLRHRLQRLLGPADPGSKRLNLRDIVRGIPAAARNLRCRAFARDGETRAEGARCKFGFVALQIDL
jgi:hypothetical protein